MSDIAIQVENLGKYYYIGGPQKQFSTLGEQVIHAVASPFRRAGKLLRGQATGAAELDNRIWALKNVGFQINPGEVVGIIGRNGAGKSTLLKILSRITEPSAGFADIYGRVGSLLEVGTGFHPELTGRENVFLNGTILGMKRREIESKFDEMVEFAEIGQFIDTPVKHYSSGMYVRLAFSVAAHLEPEILLVDEVLAVGDVEFQRKCLGKMDDVSNQGRTVLFVSHNMGLIQTLCERGIYLEKGSVAIDGTVREAVDGYLGSMETAHSEDLSVREDRRGLGDVKLIRVEYFGGSRDYATILKSGSEAKFVFQLDNYKPGLNCNILIYDTIGQPVTSFSSKVRGPEDTFATEMGNKFICELDELMLLPGRYRLDVAITGDNRLQDFIHAAAIFDVGEGDIRGRPAVAEQKFKITIPHRWIGPVQ